AVAAAARLGVWMVNVHASGGVAMMRAARDAAHAEAARRSQPAPLVIAVTMLTSFDEAGAAEVGFNRSIPEQVERLAKLAQSAGRDGCVSSPQGFDVVRRACGNGSAIVSPGIRGAADAKGDQSLTLTAAEALAAGATYLVVGRPVIGAADPRAAAERLGAECKAFVS